MKRPPKAKITRALPPAALVKAQDAGVPAPVTAPKVYVLRYWESDEREVKWGGRLFFTGPFEPLAVKIRRGDRLFVQAWRNGELTGSAALLCVAMTYTDGVFATKTWGWSKGGTIEALKALSWNPEPDAFPVYSHFTKPENEGGRPHETLTSEILGTTGFDGPCNESRAS